MSENDDHDRGSGGCERRAGEIEERYEDVFGVRPAADDIPPGEPQDSISWGSDDPGADALFDAASYI